MKAWIASAVLLVGCSSLLAADLTDPKSPKTAAEYKFLSLPGKDYKLTFSDEFDGEKLKADRWKMLLPWAGAEDHHWHTDGYGSWVSEEDVSLSGGQLHLATRKVDTKGKLRTFHYTEGMVHTSDKYRFQFGYTEVRAKAPYESGKGLWPAFWTLADGWPPEFDVIEIWTSEPRLHQGYCFEKPKGQGWESYHAKTALAGWHTYGMEWGPGYIFFSIDGTINKRIFGDHVTSKAQYLILNSGVCSGVGNIGPDENTKFPNSFDVDYCRVFQRPEAPAFHNGDFESSDLRPWTTSKGVAVSTESHSGEKALKLTDGPQWAEQKIYGLSPKTTYTLSAVAKSVKTATPIRIGVKRYGGDEMFKEISSTSWTSARVTFTTGEADTTAVIYAFNPTGAGGVVDDFKISK